MSAQQTSEAVCPVEVLASSPPPVARRAVDADAEDIAALLLPSSKLGLTLPRPAWEVRARLDEFVIVREVAGPDAGRAVACGAIETVCPGLGEIRSIATDASCGRRGAGGAAVRMLLEMAEERGLGELVLLTKIRGFFERFGFVEIPAVELPPPFIQRVLLARGRTVAGRIAMRRA